jgi:inorganic triphosphatase YgiF
MRAPKEIELKLEIPDSALARVARTSPLRKRRPAAKRTLISVYYDTAKQKLRKRGLTLRVRRDGRRYLQTIKAEGAASSALMDRFELEQAIKGPRPNLGPLRNGKIGKHLDKHLGKKALAQLTPKFETRIKRVEYRIRKGDSTIALAIDSGTIVAGRRTKPLCQVELELKQGDPAALFHVAHALAFEAPLRLSVTTKSGAGYALLNGTLEKAVGAADIVVPPDADCATAFRICARACLYQVVANQPVAHKGDSDGVHQARVGLRRLRAAVSIFSGMLTDPQSAAMKDELRWIARELGPARDIDVFISGVVKPATAGKSDQPGVASLTRELRQRKREAIRRVREAIDSERYRMLVFDLAAWIEAGGWTQNEDELARAFRLQPAATLATAEMSRRYRKIMKRGGKLHTLEPERRHRMRIQAKKLRYACEFFAATFPGGKASARRKPMIAALKQLQDSLGELNDIAVHARLTERLALPPEKVGGQPRSAANKAFAAGRLSGRQEARATVVLHDAERAFRHFSKCKPFWP